MMLGLGYLQMYSYFLQRIGRRRDDQDMAFDSFREIRRRSGTRCCSSSASSSPSPGLASLGYLAQLSDYLYGGLGPTAANIAIGVLGAAFDNIPLMFAVLTMNPDMSSGQWMLVTLSTGRRRQSGVHRLGGGRGADGAGAQPLHVSQPSSMGLGHCAGLRGEHPYPSVGQRRAHVA